jgi:hypothetical protein
VESDVGNAAGLGSGEIGAAGVATIGGGLPRRCAGAGNMAIEHRHKAPASAGLPVSMTISHRPAIPEI